MHEGHQGNLFAGLPQALSQEQFETLHRAGAVRIERICSRGQTSPEGFWYDQPEDEWVALLEGAARLEFADGREVTLARGDWLLIPARSRHRVKWTDPTVLCVWLAVHVPPPAP